MTLDSITNTEIAQEIERKFNAELNIALADGRYKSVAYWATALAAVNEFYNDHDTCDNIDDYLEAKALGCSAMVIVENTFSLMA